MQRFQNLAIADPSELGFGSSPQPSTTRRGLVVGGGMVYPEPNFTLPPMLVEETTMPEVRNEYWQIITGAVQRAVELEAPGLVIEFETLPPMTEHPPWGAELARILVEALAGAHARHELKSVLRVSPNDTREMVRPPGMPRGARRDTGLKIHPRELSWLDRIEKTVETIPDNEAEFTAEMMAMVDTTRFVPADYDS